MKATVEEFARFRSARPHRLAWPRTPPFHGDNRGSNPLGDAKSFHKFEIRSKSLQSAVFVPFRTDLARGRPLFTGPEQPPLQAHGQSHRVANVPHSEQRPAE